ncbi:MAG: HAD hydrolase family protein [Roseburia sp.]
MDIAKATGIQYVLDHYGLRKEDAYVFGDSNNDLPMLTYIPNSVAMGNASPASLFDEVSYVTKKASEDGISVALEHFGFI